MCSPENVAEEPLELLPEDAVDDEVDGGVQGDQEVGHLGQLGDLHAKHLECLTICLKTKKKSRGSVGIRRYIPKKNP